MRLARLLPAFVAAGALLAACGGSTGSTTTPSATVPSDLSISSFTADFSYMAKLKDLTAAGKGKVAVLLPDTTSSVRYVQFDQPYLQKAFEMAGYKSSDFTISNAQGQEAQELAQAQTAISNGATVLIMDPLNSTVGSQIQNVASQKGVKVISYDRATFTGTNTYYVSFDNVQVGELIGKGFVQCVSDWGVKNAQVFELDGGQNSDPNAVSFAQGYNDAIWGKKVAHVDNGTTNSQGMKLVGEQVATDWKNDVGQTIFQQAYTANAAINATVEANDGLGNAVVTVLKSKGVKAKSVPTTGQDATPDGIANTLTDYQCGSVYKAVYLEAQAAVALATVLRASATPPPALVNGTTAPPSPVAGSTQQPAILLVPIWVNKANIKDTVIKDNFVDKAALCQKVTAAVCTAAGIS
ncbi:MAG: substrate-binding domain-containing protein [Chloroflexi bacterium]|nr:MAG: substrate-binding domain-containing protein [Chloroflexota bacterium]TMG08582.1 MAG: substrate-binding domain-containing protein [Chloroflexota bacterium]TMG22124.1 MAG: substrate-binding domain-containing protein [Chloroflexota bacterium]TMG68158.1 MAG: substrate-binding domain-containing protein [Chloroflexota bacterium]